MSRNINSKISFCLSGTSDTIYTSLLFVKCLVITSVLDDALLLHDTQPEYICQAATVLCVQRVTGILFILFYGRNIFSLLKKISKWTLNGRFCERFSSKITDHKIIILTIVSVLSIISKRGPIFDAIIAITPTHLWQCVLGHLSIELEVLDYGLQRGLKGQRRQQGPFRIGAEYKEEQRDFLVFPNRSLTMALKKAFHNMYPIKL